MRTRSGSWLLLYGTRLAGGAGDRTAVIIQPASPAAVAPPVTLAYGLSERESRWEDLAGAPSGWIAKAALDR